MRPFKKIAIAAITGTLLPLLSHADGGMADNIKSLHSVLDKLYDDMIPLSSQMIDVSRAIAGFAALFYIAARVWRHIANAEPVEFFPLLRPISMGIIILMFPTVLSIINGVMKPTVTATAQMAANSNQAIANILARKEAAILAEEQAYYGNQNSDPSRWDKYTATDTTGMGVPALNPVSSAGFSFSLGTMIKRWIAELLEILYQAAALCINTIRTFNLIVLAILGPLVFGLSVFDGFGHTLKHWLARYINVYLWLPVANIFGAIIAKIQENMWQGDADFNSTDTAYLVFLVIAILGFLSVPSIAGFIMQVGGQGSLLPRVNNISSNVVSSAGSGMSGITGAGSDIKQGYNSGGGSNAGSPAGMAGSMGYAAGKAGAYMYNKLK